MNECRKTIDVWIGYCHGVPLVGYGLQASLTVFANDFEKMRTLDILGTCCPVCGSGICIAMSPDVYAEMFGVHRMFDNVVYGAGSGVAATGSPDVYANSPAP